MATLTEQLREAIETAGVSRYQISKATGISQPTLSKFALGQRGLSNKAMDAVGEYLGLSICKKQKKSSAKKRRS